MTLPSRPRSLWQATARAEAACRSSAAFGVYGGILEYLQHFSPGRTRRSRISRRRRSERCAAALPSPSSAGACRSSRVGRYNLAPGGGPHQGRSQPPAAHGSISGNALSRAPGPADRRAQRAGAGEPYSFDNPALRSPSTLTVSSSGAKKVAPYEALQPAMVNSGCSSSNRPSQ
jgi:hypothetical protein